MESIYAFVVLLLIDWILGFAVGWFSRGAIVRRSSSGRLSPADEDERGRVTGDELQSLKSLHAEVRRELSTHAATLHRFEHFVQSLLADADEGLAQSLREQLGRVRSANQQVMAILQRASGQLSYLVRFCGQLLANEQRQIDGYRGTTARLDEILAAVDSQSVAEGRMEELVTRVRSLQQQNARLQQELDDCQAALSEQISAASLAVENVRVDVLTQLPNRRGFEEKLAELQEEFTRDGRAYVVVFIDIDRFQETNDQFGHAVGDAALAMLGRVFRENQSKGQHVSRFDGDQFALLLPNYTLDQARAVAGKFREKVEGACLRFADSQVRATASLGVAQAVKGEPQRGVIVRAESALAAAKRAGGNQVYLDKQAEPAVVG
jgi:diguanylate cyclase (GGDEF)-like protein